MAFLLPNPLRLLTRKAMASISALKSILRPIGQQLTLQDQKYPDLNFWYEHKCIRSKMTYEHFNQLSCRKQSISIC